MVAILIANDIPLYQQTIDKIYELIDSNEIAPGESFPPERELAKRWGISRNSLRDAFHILEHRGVVISRQGSGRYLRNRIDTVSLNSQSDYRAESISHAIEKSSLFDIYYARQVIEPKIVELVARYASDEQIFLIRERYEDFVVIFEKSGKTTEELDIHRLYAGCCKNFLLAEMAEQAYQATEDLMSNRFKSEYYDKHTVDECLKAHDQIVSEIERRDTEAASRAMHNHLQHTLDMF